MPKKTKNILVTGGAGFLGSHLCERLINEGHRVICLDDFSTGSRRHIEHLLQESRFQFLRLNVNEEFDLESYKELSEFKIPFEGLDEVYHLACPTSIKNFEQFKIQTLLSNSVGTWRVLEVARKYDAKILLTSSSVVYGDRQNDDPFFDEDEQGIVDHLTPRGCYDEGKRYAETMFETYKQVYEMDTKIARIFRTYGPRMPVFDGHLIPDFILHALDGKDLVIYGDETFKTSLLYVTDLIDGLIRVMNAQEDIGPVNLGTDTDVRMSDVAKMIIEMTGSNSDIDYKEKLPFLTEMGLPNIQKAKSLGWLPLTRLEDGIRKTVEYMESNKMQLNEITV